MGTRIRDHIRSNVVGYVAVFLALSGTAAATHTDGDNTIDSGDIIDGQVFTEDVAANTVKSADIADGRIFNVDVANDVFTGEKIKDGTLTGDDIDESTLEGVANVVDGPGASVQCCGLRAQILDTAVAFDAGNGLTFMDLGVFELRSLAQPVAGRFQICNTDFNSPRRLFIYTGGADASTTDTRETNVILQNSCETVDVNAAQTNGTGNFRILVPTDDIFLQGANDGVGGQMDIIGMTY